MTATGYPSASEADRATRSIPSPAIALETIAKGWEALACASQPSGCFLLAESDRDTFAVPTERSHARAPHAVDGAAA